MRRFLFAMEIAVRRAEAVETTADEATLLVGVLKLPEGEFDSLHWAELALRKYALSRGFTEGVAEKQRYSNPQNRVEYVQLVSARREPPAVVIYDSVSEVRKTFAIEVQETG